MNEDTKRYLEWSKRKSAIHDAIIGAIVEPVIGEESQEYLDGFTHAVGRIVWALAKDEIEGLTYGK